MRLKQTALSPCNPKNEPDPYEKAVLGQFAAKPGSRDPSSELADGGRTLRLLVPIYYETACMGCHGEPKGVEEFLAIPGRAGMWVNWPERSVSQSPWSGKIAHRQTKAPALIKVGLRVMQAG